MTEANKPYGLVLRGKAALAKSAPAPKPAAFGSDQSDDDDEGQPAPRTKPARPAWAAKEKRATKLQHAEALAEDPTIFDYDAAYEQMQEHKSKIDAEKKATDKLRKPKYMDKLMRAAKQRELEKVAREERKQNKERIEEGDQFADKEVFVTGSYRKQMEEMQIYREEEAKRDYAEKAMAVHKQKDLSGFYRHMLNDMIDDRTAVAKEEPKTEEPLDDDEQKHAQPSTAAVKSEPPTHADDADQRPAGRSDAQAQGRRDDDDVSKSKVYRRRRRTTNSSDDDQPSSPVKDKTQPQQHKSIYSESDSDGADEDRRPEPPRKGGLQLPRAKIDRSGASGETRSEQRARRYFTPEPHESDNDGEHADGDQPAKSPQERSPTPTARPQQSPTEDGGSDTEEKKPADPVAERMRKLRIIFARKATDELLDEYRQRYFERKANGEIVPPV